jgi:hypothetical protein
MLCQIQAVAQSAAKPSVRILLSGDTGSNSAAVKTLLGLGLANLSIRVMPGQPTSAADQAAPQTPLYMHVKQVIVDGAQAFVGSENLTNTSLLQNRGLGTLFSDPGMTTRLPSVFDSDFDTPGHSLPAHACTGGDGCAAAFTNGQTILTDNLPNASLTYGAVSAGNGSGVTGVDKVSCAIASSALTCSATGAVSIDAAGLFDVTFTATPSAGGVYANPRSAGTCAVDPNNVIGETNETNNQCSSDAVTVSQAPAITSADHAAFVVANAGTLTVTTSGYPSGSSMVISATGSLPSGVTITGATLNAAVNANYASSTVTFEYGLDSGYGATISATPATVTGSADTSVSAILTGLTPGTSYHFRVTGSNIGGTSHGSDMTFTTQTAATTTTLTWAEHSSPSGQKWTLTASVTSDAGAPTGTVTFKDGTTVLGTSGLSNGSAVLEIDPLAGGAHTLTAEYSGDSSYNPSVSDALVINTKNRLFIPLVLR